MDIGGRVAAAGVFFFEPCLFSCNDGEDCISGELDATDDSRETRRSRDAALEPPLPLPASLTLSFAAPTVPASAGLLPCLFTGAGVGRGVTFDGAFVNVGGRARLAGFGEVFGVGVGVTAADAAHPSPSILRRLEVLRRLFTRESESEGD